MTTDRFHWPVRLVGVGKVAVSAGAVLWRSRGAQEARLTVLAKATFGLVAEGVASPQRPDALTLEDKHHANDAKWSVAAPSDLAPYRAGAEVLVVGHAYAAPGRPVASAGARLLVHRDRDVLVQKTIDIHGDRHLDRAGRVTEPVPFQRMPLLFERAVLHPVENPVGIDPSRGRVPNLIDPRDPSRPACFGPLAAHWPARARHLRGLSAQLVSGTHIELPQDFDWTYFYAAPPDQRTSFLRGDESISLGGMHPTLPVLRTRLPGVRGRACIYRGASAGQAIDLFADTLLIDTDRQVCSLVFRSNLAVTDAELPSLVIAAAVELPGQPLEFPERLPGAAVAHDAALRKSSAESAEDEAADAQTVMKVSPREKPVSIAVSEDDEEPFAGTMMISHGTSAARPAMPFVPKAPDAEGQTSSNLPPRAPMPSRAAESDDEPFGETIGPSLAAIAKGPALPFPNAPAKPPRIVAPPKVELPPLPAPPSVVVAPEEEEGFAGTLMLHGGASVPKGPALPFVPGSGEAALPPPGQTISRDALDALDALEDAEERFSGTLHLTEEAAASRGPVLPFITPNPPPRSSDSPPPPPEVPVRLGDTIPVFGDSRFAIVTLPWQVRPPRDSLTVVVKATCALVPSASAEILAEPDMPTGDVYEEDAPERGLVYASDIAIFKPKADITFAGRAYAPGGRGVASEVSVRFGRGKNAFARRIAVFGDRRWEKSVVTLAPTQPQPFESIPLGWERAFGGADFLDNPLGVGLGASAGADGVARLPNFEDPERLISGPSDKPRPAGLGPISALWRQRWSKLGTYDGRWREQRWPYFPDDFDWAHFQAAPLSQQLEHLVGDEPFDIRGMHKSHPRLEGRLPMERPRCFYQRTEQAGGQFGEVRLVLDTVHFDVEAMKMELVWRGILEVEDEDAPEIAALFVMAEHFGPKASSLDEARRAFLESLRAGDEEEDEGEEAMAAEPSEGEQKERAVDPEEAAMEAKLAALVAEAQQRKKKIAEEMRAAKIPDIEMTKGKPDPARTLEAMRSAGATEEQIAQMAALLAPEPANAAVAPNPTLRARVLEMLEADEPFDGMDLSGADLAGLDFTHRSLIGVDLRGAKLRGCAFVSADLTEALLSGADLAGACLDGATLQMADLTECCLEDATLKEANVEGADFTSVRGARARFDGARGEGGVFASGVWEGARFDGAWLPKADFTGASLAGAVFNGATLSDGMLYDVRGASAFFEEAKMQDARCDGAELLRASFRKASAVGSTWENAKLDGASFVGADLSSSIFVRASCIGASFSGAEMKEANLRRAKLEKAAFFQTNLMEASLSRADLTKADMRRCNLHGAETWKAKLQGADLNSALITQTKLGRRA